MAKKPRPVLKKRPPTQVRRAAPNAPTVLAPGVKSAADVQLDGVVETALRLYHVQEFAKARAALEKVLTQRPEHYLALCTLGQVLARGYEDFEAARAVYERAQKARPGHSRARVLLAEALSQTGRTEEAIALARDALAENAKAVGAYRLLAELAPTGFDDDAIGRMIELAADERMGPLDRRKLYAALGRIHEKQQDYDAAFDYFARSNALDAGEHDTAVLDQRLAATREAITPAFFETRRGFGVKDQRNVFVIGMPRSGSTLLEQVALAHPRVDSVGESNAVVQVERFLNARMAESGAAPGSRIEMLERLSKSDAQLAANRYFKLIDIHIHTKNPLRILNKSLVNFAQLPLLKLLFPQARFVHTFRQPMDTLVSCYTQDFLGTAFAARFDWLAHYFNYYSDLMELWVERFGDELIHVCHEDFVTGFEEKAPVFIDALGLPWDDACARPHERKGVVYTASSAQVRKPVNASGFGRWRNYETHLGPLIKALGGLDKVEARYERFRVLSI